MHLDKKSVEHESSPLIAKGHFNMVACLCRAPYERPIAGMRVDPSFGLLSDRLPRGQSIGNHKLWAVLSDYAEQSVKNLTHRVFALWRILPQQGEIGSAEPSFFISNVASTTNPTSSISSAVPGCGYKAK